MVGLPVFMMAALLTISPSHREFYSQPSGWALIALAVVLDALAYLMMRKMATSSSTKAPDRLEAP